MKILFTKGATPFILQALGKSIDDKGFVVDGDKKFVRMQMIKNLRQKT